MLQSLFQQHTDPVAFLQTHRTQLNRGIWLPAWRRYLGYTSATLLGLGALMTASGERLVMGWALLALFVTFAAASIPVTLTHQAQFWFLYFFSPLRLVLAFLLGASVLAPAPLFLLMVVGPLPYSLGMMVAEAGVLWVHKCVEQRQGVERQLRTNGPLPDLPELGWQEQVWLVRLVLAGGLGLLVVFGVSGLFGGPADELVLDTLLLGSLAVGVLRFEATVLGWLRQAPLVVYDEALCEWRASYVGRFSLIASQRQLGELLTLAGSPTVASIAVLTLLRQGNLGRALRRAVARLAPEKAERLILQLSLRAGGAAAIEYLHPAISPALQAIAARYAILAREAAKPLDQQRWLAALPDAAAPDMQQAIGQAAEVGRTLVEVRQALLCYEPGPLVDRACQGVRRCIQTVENEGGRAELPDPGDPTCEVPVEHRPTPWNWLHALLIRLEEHGAQLRTT
jgi:hypothetical protein